MYDFIISFLLPLTTGTLAGALINWALEQSRTAGRRKKILTALHAQLETLPRINLHNQTSTDKQAGAPKHLLPIPYPITPFETAIFSENGISVSDKTIQAVSDYLLKARELNILIEALRDSHLDTFEGRQEPANKYPTQTFIYDQAKANMSQNIETLIIQFQAELKMKDRKKRL